MIRTTYHGDAAAEVSGQPKGSEMTISFELEGQPFFAINGGPHFTFTPAISLLVNCDSQEEIDALWEKLSADPSAEQCGWLKDSYDVSWQIVPGSLEDDISASDPEVSERVMRTMLSMKKLDIAALKRARDGV
jgi:predicted 3-demethylubiquinone-9 3-methyltransferase (glyoxalase superfamily)